VRVEAGAILVNELNWDETHQSAAGAPRPFPIPGRDLCGIVVGTKMGPQMGPQRGKPRLEDSVTYFKPSRPR
jgi:hypothetical protein